MGQDATPGPDEATLYRAAFEFAPDAILVIGSDGTVRRMNGHAEQLLGWPRAELVGLPVETLVPEALRGAHVDHREGFARAPRTRPMGVALDLEARRRDGTMLPVEIALGPLDWGGEAVVLCVVRDIRVRKEAEQALRRAHDELEERVRERTAQLERSNRELEAFAFVASHDLQEPLRKIRAFGERLADRHGDALGDAGRDYVDRMRSAALRMQTLIGDLLDYSRVNSRARPSVPVDLGEVARQVVVDLEVRIEEAGARVEIGPLPTLPADPTQMRQLLQNLLGNALKFRSPDRPLFVRISARQEAPGVRGARAFRLEVADNGIGFAPEYRDRIFGLFQRLHGRDSFEGTGVGLAICRKIVERHGGRIEADSKPGQGATFVVTLPAPAAPKGDAP